MKDMENFDKGFDNVFEGIRKTMDAIDHELDVLQTINKEQKIELRKAKHFNIFMAALSIVSIVLAVVSVIIAIK